jgi:hypothetical protein
MRARLISAMVVCCALLLLVTAVLTQAQEGVLQGHSTTVEPLGSVFTYQGRLLQRGNPLSGTCDLMFSLWDSATGGTQVGSTQTKTGVNVSNGLFTVLLNFGAVAFGGDARWLEVSVRSPAGSGDYTTLSPRQAVTAVPYALYARNAWSLTGNSGIMSGTHFLGTTDDQALELKVDNTRALRLEPHENSPNVIGGYSGNSVAAGVYGATIGGGGGHFEREPGLGLRVPIPNQAGGAWSTVGGGAGNSAEGWLSTIGGGGGVWRDHRGYGEDFGNAASGVWSTVSGGGGNIARGYAATVGGGGGRKREALPPRNWQTRNIASGDWSTVGGGAGNVASGLGTTIGGGGPGGFCWERSEGWVCSNNQATEAYATIGGGYLNSAAALTSTIGGGEWITVTGKAATVAGGSHITVAGDYAAVGGGQNNRVTPPGLLGSAHATISGGYSNTVSAWGTVVGGGMGNTASEMFATVGGGEWNTASGWIASVGGGHSNTASSYLTTVGGGFDNTASGRGATVGGGAFNTASRLYATIGGGTGISVTGEAATVAGGSYVTVTGDYAAVGGGQNNNASDSYATIGGGRLNTASRIHATVGGGHANSATGPEATVPGGGGNLAQGAFSFAAGRDAQALNRGAFVWADSTGAAFASYRDNQFRVRATGGARFDYNNNRWVEFYDTGTRVIGTHTGAYLSTGGVWTNASDQKLKENFALVEGQQVLERVANIPIGTWNYKSQDPSIRHMGPSAQDFYAAFGLGEYDTHISTVDADGVSLAAIQALYELSQEQAGRIQELEAKNASLEGRLAALEAVMARLLQQTEGGR